ncbi:HTH-type transcriptional activator RhaS [Starkeya nomas]|uniref:HTH-type transcriptional activator RhaS n=2 Tax=Xanthobacteraceae TaxID=335928 RepID=A0A5S9PSL6_9HYPH|nr:MULTISPECIES: AraC family transcriptional regulator [Xanthobacteraceae]TSJ64474.1 helix-turn-helix transcriptional regulator [Ancylobacter moscoviensis]CAA0107353.1 HTH-type transcriptional activator RhaS [Starkeya nomas]
MPPTLPSSSPPAPSASPSVHRPQRILGGIPDEWGPKFEHDGGAATRTHTGPNAIRFTAPAHMALVLLTPQPGRQIALNSDRKITGFAPVGSLEIIPADSDIFARWKTEKQNVLVAADSSRLARLAGLEFDKDSFELRPPRLGFVDDMAHMMALRIRREVENFELGCEETLDALVTLFATHLLRNYSSLSKAPPRIRSAGLTYAAWSKVNEFIQAHIGRTLTLEELAAIANLSPSHFSRAFRQTTGQSPYQYVISSRLVQARDLIVNTDTPLNVVASAVGFTSHSHMGMVMRRAWGMTPSECRQER